MKHKVTFAEALFAKIFNIIAGKSYLVSWQWRSSDRSRFIPLNATFRNLFLLITGVLTLGLAGLLAETGTWLYREASLEYGQKKNATLKRDLSEVITQQIGMETTLDSLSHFEEKIRALYGMNSHDKDFLAFGVGGRRPEIANQPYGMEVADNILHSSLKNRQLQGKIKFTNGSFQEITEFVHYRHNLWEHTPFILPTRGNITSGFGSRLHPVTGEQAVHEGLDIANSKWTPIYASADGIVASSASSGNFGNLVVIDHGNGYLTKYGHMAKVMVEKGQLVKRYGLVGYMGDTGRATGTHLHYEVHRDGIPQNPEKYILPSGILVD